jgi:hypothetical protein
MQSRISATVLLLAASFAALGVAQPPAAAIVESVNAPSAGVQELDYVTSGQVIELGQDGTLTLGYLSSCERERIEGGTVTIGRSQSTVVGGSVKRLKIVCDGGSLQLSAEQSQQSLTVVFRDYDPNKGKNLPKPQAILYGVSPLVSLGAAGSALSIRRIDRTEQPVDIVMDHATVDLAPLGISLTPGGLYQAKVAGRGITFKIDPSASDGGPLLGRLLRF